MHNQFLLSGMYTCIFKQQRYESTCNSVQGPKSCEQQISVHMFMLDRFEEKLQVCINVQEGNIEDEEGGEEGRREGGRGQGEEKGGRGQGGGGGIEDKK